MSDKKQPVDKIIEKELTYIEKVWHTVAIVALLVIIILIARVAFNVLLMALAGTLIAVYFHGLGDIIQRKTKFSRLVCMLISVLGSVILLGVLIWFMGTKIQNQVSALSNTLPATISNAKAKMAETETGRKVIDYLTGGDNTSKLLTTAQSFFSSSFGVLGDIYVILFLGIFFTASPSLYKNGMILLMPPAQKPLAKKVIDRISLALKGWLKGTMLAMVMIVILLPIALNIVGIPVALVLGLITAILVIVPNIGSFAAMIPGVLLGLTISFNTAVIVAIIYIVIQTIVSNIITPLIQKKMINLPPALTLISQLIMGALAGVLGIVLAVPLLAITMILVDELYVQRINKTAD